MHIFFGHQKRLPICGTRWSDYCHSWNHETAQFDPVHFDNPAHITWHPSPEYSPALIDHSLGQRPIALTTVGYTTRLFDACTGHLHARILGSAYPTMAFIRDGTALAYYDPYYGLRIWELEDLLVEHQHITDGYELMLRGMRDGWVMGQDDEPLFWLPVENREGLYAPPPKVLIEGSYISTILDFSHSRLG